MLYRLVYVSEAVKGQSIDTTKPVGEAKEFNLDNRVTGALWFDGTYFVQLLEGEKEHLSLIFQTRIEASRSHHNICLACFEPCNDRLFQDWSMAYLSDKSHCAEIAHQFMQDNGFHPRDCTSDDLINLLRFLEEDRQRNRHEAII